jgi:predicted transcriptional regulator of viral defense system
MEPTLIEKTLKIASKTGVIQPKDLDQYGIPRKYLHILYRKGLLDKIGRGLYVSPELAPTENRSLAEICKRIPHAVVCLISALQFHDLTTQLPSKVWIAVDRKARLPNAAVLPVRVYRFSGKALTEGVEEHKIEGVTVKVYNPAKTVADCFKYRNKIGLSIALEALKDCLQQRKCKPADIDHYARICRISSVIRPYLEAVI